MNDSFEKDIAECNKMLDEIMLWRGISQKEPETCIINYKKDELKRKGRN